ncbi:SAM hydrolase/SAM-dependent halogenase family protein [Flexithrix dorotheae]|uniref:SAM hydrolase/SAM-dependent halogenase family protein n=1 Tax=Flexithrix dorotheae TaxID=70993 RepID=UPI00037ED1D7|nr:SAM-dependent chlorinase/fluorinase [Flexithrix dorotheae]
MPIITFISDFGNTDFYVASVKAAILCHFPNQQIIDISHSTDCGNIAYAGFNLKAVYQDFPEGTIHLVAIGTTDSFQNQHLLVKINGHYFIGPDNGIFSLITEEEPEIIINLFKPDNWIKSFPAKSIYANIVVRLLSGHTPEEFGEPISYFQKRTLGSVSVNKNQIKGKVIYVDFNGNLITNIDLDTFQKIRKERRYEVEFEYESIRKITHHYSVVEFGDCVVIFNSLGYLEIAINQGNASNLLGMTVNSPVLVSFHPEIN